MIDDTTTPSPTPPAAEPPALVEPAPAQPAPVESTSDAPADADRLLARSWRERLTGLPVLLGTIGVLAIVSILLALMVFAPSVAPLKLGAARLVADNGEIETVARRFARNFLTIDYQTLDEDVDRVLADSTGAFRNKMERLLDVVGELLVKAESVSVGRVTTVTVLSRREDSAMVSASVSRTISNARRPDARPTQHTLLITLVRTSSDWKVDDLTEIPSAGTRGIVPE